MQVNPSGLSVGGRGRRHAADYPLYGGGGEALPGEIAFAVVWTRVVEIPRVGRPAVCVLGAVTASLCWPLTEPIGGSLDSRCSLRSSLTKRPTTPGVHRSDGRDQAVETEEAGS